MRTLKLSLSVSDGKVAELHSRRVYTPASADESLNGRNVHIIDPRHDDGSLVTYRDQFEDIFAGAVERYNSKQKRKDRRKVVGGYYDEVAKGTRKERPVYSTVLQLGDRDTAGVTDTLFDREMWLELRESKPEQAARYVAGHLSKSEAHERAKQCLMDIVDRWPKWFPQLKIVSAVLHDDEPDGTPHVHIDWVPVAGGEGADTYKRGMDTRCSINSALKDMGYDGKGYAYPILQWRADFKARAEEVMASHWIAREFIGDEAQHADVATYRLQQQRHDAAVELAELKRRQGVAMSTIKSAETELANIKNETADAQDELERTRKEAEEVRAQMIEQSLKRRHMEQKRNEYAKELERIQAQIREAQAAEKRRREEAEAELQKLMDEAKKARLEREVAAAERQKLLDETKQARQQRDVAIAKMLSAAKDARQVQDEVDALIKARKVLGMEPIEMLISWIKSPKCASSENTKRRMMHDLDCIAKPYHAAVHEITERKLNEARRAHDANKPKPKEPKPKERETIPLGYETPRRVTMAELQAMGIK